MNLKNIPNNREGMHQLYEHLKPYAGRYPSLRSLLSYSLDRDFMGRGIEYASSFEMIHRTEHINVSSMPPMDYAEILYLVAKGVEKEREGYTGIVEYVEVDKSEALYANLVKEQKDRHEAILEAVNALLDSDIPSDQAIAINMISEWRDSLPKESDEGGINEGLPKLKFKPEIEL